MRRRGWLSGLLVIGACGRVHFDDDVVVDGGVGATDDAVLGPPPSDDLIGHWKFDEGSGLTTFDSSPSSFHGMISGATWVPGHVGPWALQFDGVDDYVLLGDVLAMSSSFSASAWMYAEEVGLYDNRLITHGNGVGQRNWVLRDEYGITTFEIYPDNTTELRQSDISATPAKTWVHYVGVYDAQAQTMDLYRDGQLVNDRVAAPPSSIPPASSESIIGKNYSTGNRAMFGMIDDVRVYARALTRDEALAIYHAR